MHTQGQGNQDELISVVLRLGVVKHYSWLAAAASPTLCWSVCSTEDRYQRHRHVLSPGDYGESNRHRALSGQERGRASAVLRESVGDVRTPSSEGWPADSGQDVADQDCDSHTDSDLASLLDSIEHARRRIKAQDEAESRLDAAVYAGGLFHFARSAAATTALLSRNVGGDTCGVIYRGAGPAARATVMYASSRRETEGVGAEGFRGGEAAISRDASVAPWIRPYGSPLSKTAVGAALAPIEPAVEPQSGLPKEGPDSSLGFSKEGKGTTQQASSGSGSGTEVAAEMKRNSLLSAAMADLKEELRTSQEELTKARSMAHLYGRVLHKLREWRDLKATTDGLGDQELSPAEKCLQEIETILARGDQDGNVQAQTIETLQQDLASCREAKRLAELQGESLRNEISFLQLVNAKITEKREEEHSKALEALKEHVDKKVQEIKEVQEEKEALRRELDHLKSHYAEHLAATDASKAALQHELDATKHVSSLKLQEMEDTVERLRNENQQLRQQKETAEERLRHSAQAERLAQLEREEVQEKQARLAAQHEALRESLNEIRSSAAEARRKWLDRHGHVEREGAATRDREHASTGGRPGHSTVSLSSLSNACIVQEAPATGDRRPRTFQSSGSCGRQLPPNLSIDGTQSETPSEGAEKRTLEVQEAKKRRDPSEEEANRVQTLEDARVQDADAWDGVTSFRGHPPTLRPRPCSHLEEAAEARAYTTSTKGLRATTGSRGRGSSTVAGSADSPGSCQEDEVQNEGAPALRSRCGRATFPPIDSVPGKPHLGRTAWLKEEGAAPFVCQYV